MRPNATCMVARKKNMNGGPRLSRIVPTNGIVTMPPTGRTTLKTSFSQISASKTGKGGKGASY